MLLNSAKIDAKISSILLIKPLLAVIISSGFTVYANAGTLISSTDYLEYELPQSIQEQCYQNNNCPKIEVKYLKTNHDWINSVVNARVNNIVINSKPSESAINKATSAKAAKLAIDNFAKSQFIDMPAAAPWSYNLMVTPEYLGHIKLGYIKPSAVKSGNAKLGNAQSGQNEDLELFEINSYVFTGGAHGMPFSEYLIFDPSTKTQLKLADMLQSGQEPRFKALAYDAYKRWVKTVDKDISSYEKNWPFTLSDNVTLTDKGLDIRYQHYAIGPYAYGMPKLSIPYNQLNNIIKPRFLP